MKWKEFGSLNPYSTGSWVAGSFKKYLSKIDNYSLNPYSTGSWVAGAIQKSGADCSRGLNPYSTGSWVAGILKNEIDNIMRILG